MVGDGGAAEIRHDCHEYRDPQAVLYMYIYIIYVCMYIYYRYRYMLLYIGLWRDGWSHSEALKDYDTAASNIGTRRCFTVYIYIMYT